LKIAFNTWMYAAFPAWLPLRSLDDVIDLAAELGFDGLGFSDVDLKSFGLGDVELDDDQAGDGGDPKPDVNLPDRRVSLMFSSEQWDELKDTLNGKPTAEEVLRLVKLGKRSGITPSAEAKGTLASVASKARKK